LEEVVLALLQADKVRQEVTPLQVFHLTLPQFVVVEVEVVDLQEQIQELMVDQVVVDLQQVVNHLLIILEQVFVDKVILVGTVLMQLLPL
jgi:NH3-dependent NAD+ synthetase